MREFKYVVTDPEGIHARPAGELVKAVKAFSSDIKIAKGGKAMNCKAIFGIMGLAGNSVRQEGDIPAGMSLFVCKQPVKVIFA